jgi:polysaccharide export outer membrane protein
VSWQTKPQASAWLLPQAGWRRLVFLCGIALLTVAASSPANNLAPTSREVLGAGDTIRITVFQNPDLTTEARISEQGTIAFPMLGEVPLAGQRPVDAGAKIAELLKRGRLITNAQVTVSVVQVRSRQVSVLGQVVRPGRYALDDTSSRLVDVLAVAGGIGPAGDDTVVVTGTRDGKATRMEVDVAAMYRSGNLSRNIELQNGDTVFVQRAPVFYIYGEVQRSGAYRLEPATSVMNALSLGGGLTPRGTTRGIKIHRKAQDGSLQKLDVNLTDTVQANDVIYISESLF